MRCSHLLGLSLRFSPKCCFPGRIPSFPLDLGHLLARRTKLITAPSPTLDTFISSPQDSEIWGSLPPKLRDPVLDAWKLQSEPQPWELSRNPRGEQGRSTAAYRTAGLPGSRSKAEKLQDAAESAFSSPRGKLGREETGQRTPRTEEKEEK